MRIAVVDDNSDDLNLLSQYLATYKKKSFVQLDIQVYHSGLDLLEEYDANFDVLFLDVEMPGVNGMDLAKEIRRVDESVGIIFVTNMAQYAIKGYEVNAIDFMIKPITYFNFTQKLEKAIYFSKNREEKELLLNTENGIMRMKVSCIYYIEKNKNYLLYHTKKGVFTERGTMQTIRRELEGNTFYECMTGCLVNLKFVQKIGRDSVFLETEELPMSRRMKKEFIQHFADYIGGNI
jgi:two-component system response regulator LytT